MTEGIAYARAGLLGNPSDGYGGKVLAIAVKNFVARVVLEESDDLKFLPSAGDGDAYRSTSDFLGRVGLYGYDGGVRLIKAGYKTFLGYVQDRGLTLPERRFQARYASAIPRQVGLGGSSAILTAALRAFMTFYGISIPLEHQPGLVLAAERDELGINAGYMDRVAQVYEGLIYMDLKPDLFRTTGHGRYERLDPGLLPELYLAFRPDAAKVSGRVLSEIRTKFDAGDRFTIGALDRLAALAERGRAELLAGRPESLFDLINANFDLRRSIMAIRPPDADMVEMARRLGASAAFAGSGGSIVGVCLGERMFDALVADLGRLGAKVVKPVIV